MCVFLCGEMRLSTKGFLLYMFILQYCSSVLVEVCMHRCVSFFCVCMYVCVFYPPTEG